MRENKRKLRFKKVKIAKMNTLNGGGETDTVIELSDYCPSRNPDCTPYPGSDPANPCSDVCDRTRAIDTCDGMGINIGTNQGACNNGNGGFGG